MLLETKKSKPVKCPHWDKVLHYMATLSVMWSLKAMTKASLRSVFLNEPALLFLTHEIKKEKFLLSED